jgi:hypothetical protein
MWVRVGFDLVMGINKLGQEVKRDLGLRTLEEKGDSSA